jgi:hypothetical protein
LLGQLKSFNQSRIISISLRTIPASILASAVGSRSARASAAPLPNSSMTISRRQAPQSRTTIDLRAGWLTMLAFGTSDIPRRFTPAMNAPVNLGHLRRGTIICLSCHVRMREKISSKADLIQLSTRTKTVTYSCPSCDAETRRQVVIPVVQRNRDQAQKK